MVKKWSGIGAIVVFQKNKTHQTVGFEVGHPIVVSDGVNPRRSVLVCSVRGGNICVQNKDVYLMHDQIKIFNKILKDLKVKLFKMSSIEAESKTSNKYYIILPPFQNTCPIFAMCTIHLTYFDHTF
jgi:hypothetical protein